MNYDSWRALKEFDWVASTEEQPRFEREPPIFMNDVQGQESRRDRCMRMLRQLQRACYSCSMCELGRKTAKKGDELRDPHVFSNMNPRRFVVVGQNPGWDELKTQEPFVGQAGANFDKQVESHKLSRDDFYICNTVRCWTSRNATPNAEHATYCWPFLQMELQLLQPLLIIALGAVAFNRLCPSEKFSSGLMKITKTADGWPVFAVYHPSPRNMSAVGRKEAFEKQMKTMCALVKKLKATRKCY